jgi:hypothetical protein
MFIALIRNHAALQWSAMYSATIITYRSYGAGELEMTSAYKHIAPPEQGICTTKETFRVKPLQSTTRREALIFL